MKKSLFVKLLLLAVALIFVLAACDRGGEDPAPVAPDPTPAQQQQQQETPAATPEPADVDFPAIMNPVGTLPIVNEPVTLTIFTGAGADIDYTTNLGVLELEERTGIHIDWIQVPTADMPTRRNLMLATGDLPDIFVNDVGSHAAVFHYASLGIFRPITNYIDEFAPEMQRMFGYHPNVRDDMVMPDGNIYAFPAVDDCFHCSMNLKLWLYEPWLEALDMATPTTPDELYAYLVAIRDGDPSGRGLNDEIPFAAALTGWDHGFNTIITAWITNNQNRLIMQNGQVTAIYDTEEYRDALRFINRMYDSGLIAEESFTLDRAGLRQLADSVVDAGEDESTNRVGVMPAMWVGGTSTEWRDWRVIPYLIGPNGHQVALYNPLRGNNRAVITSRLPEELMPVAVRFLDSLYTDEMALLMVQGIEGLNWRYSDPGEVGIHGGPAVWERIVRAPDDPPAPINTHIGQIFPNFRSNEFRLSERANRTIIEQETLLFDESMRMLPYRDNIENIMPILIFGEAESAELVDLQTTLDSFVVESQARFIVGDLCLDNDWDWYIRELQVMGLPRFLQLQQDAVEARNARLAG